jgi:NAD(P)-dependent dehydrogenase (short-subunit alcohol dehydrogenase family)
MARIFITGSADGLGLAPPGLVDGATSPHARSSERASELDTDLGPIAIGDLSRGAETRDLARQVNDLGRMDAVIHNAGIYVESTRATTPDGHARTVAVNTLAPYLLTGLIDRPDRLVYLAHTPQFFPFGPASWNADPQAAEIVRKARAIVAIGNHMQGYISSIWAAKRP